MEGGWVGSWRDAGVRCAGLRGAAGVVESTAQLVAPQSLPAKGLPGQKGYWGCRGQTASPDSGSGRLHMPTSCWRAVRRGGAWGGRGCGLGPRKERGGIPGACGIMLAAGSSSSSSMVFAACTAAAGSPHGRQWHATRLTHLLRRCRGGCCSAGRQRWGRSASRSWSAARTPAGSAAMRGTADGTAGWGVGDEGGGGLGGGGPSRAKSAVLAGWVKV